MAAHDEDDRIGVSRGPSRAGLRCIGSRRIVATMCTFRRPMVTETLDSLAAQRLPDDTTLRVVVADNDHTPSAQETVETWVAGRAAAERKLEVRYLHAPAANISVARNAALDAADDADLIAFIDDDAVADPDWIAMSVAALDGSGADAVFGPSRAIYGPEAPDWMRAQDHHSNLPLRRGGAVRTGHTCNALLAWRGRDWVEERFDPARGRSGGEDTEFFFRLGRRGARFEIAADATVYERVDPERMSLAWLRRRKFRMGQSYASVATGPAARAVLFSGAAAKAAYCHLRAGLAWRNHGARAFWLLRGAMHAGVCGGCAGLSEPEIYGR